MEPVTESPVSEVVFSEDEVEPVVGGSDEDSTPLPPGDDNTGGGGGSVERRGLTQRDLVGQPTEEGYKPPPEDVDFDPWEYMKGKQAPLIHTTGEEPDESSESPIDADVVEHDIPGPSVVQPVTDEEGGAPGEAPRGAIPKPDHLGAGGDEPDPRGMDN